MIVIHLCQLWKVHFGQAGARCSSHSDYLLGFDNNDDDDDDNDDDDDDDDDDNDDDDDDDDDDDRIERRNTRFPTSCSLRHELTPTRTLKWPGRCRVQITCNTQSAHRVQHVVCHFLRRDGSAIKVGGAKIAFILAVFYWLKRLIDEGGEELKQKKQTSRAWEHLE